jgi:ribosome-associated translation inhibitor RaiA
MKLTVTGRHMELSAAARQSITRKLARLNRLLNDNAISAQCVVWEQRGVVVCELTVHARQDHMLHGMARHAQLVQQAQRLKDRWTTSRRADVGAGRGVRRGAISRKGKGPKAAASRRVVRAR